jgi:hypothetical protein
MISKHVNSQRQIFLMGLMSKLIQLTLLVAVITCSPGKGDNDEQKSNDDSVTQKVNVNRSGEKNYNLDTIKVDGQAVVFFTISQQEYDSLLKQPHSGLDEVLDDFNYYAGLASDSIKSAGYKTMITASRYIQIKLNNNTLKTFDRLADRDNIVGYIFSNGIKEPHIEYGVSVDSELLAAFKVFYSKEISSNIVSPCQTEYDTLTHQLIYKTADKKASFPGGFEPLMKETQKRIRLSRSGDYSNGIKVIIAFVVQHDGKVIGQRIIRNVKGTNLAEQYLDIIDDFNWEPAMCNGKPVSTIVTYPFIIDVEFDN